LYVQSRYPHENGIKCVLKGNKIIDVSRGGTSLESIAIGKDIIRKDAWEKVNGRATYTAEMTSPGLWHAVIVTSTCAHGMITGIDCLEAMKMPGVKSVLIGSSFPKLTGSVLEDRPPLATDRVRYYGEPVALVIAHSEAEACAAAAKVKVSYENLPTVNSPSEAMKPDSPIIHDQLINYKKVIPEVYPVVNSNICHQVKIRKGDMTAGWKDSDIMVEGTFTVPQADHIAMETRSARAEILPDGKIIIHTASQGPFSVRKMISDHFGVGLGDVVVHVPLVGGGYGGKAPTDLEYLAVMASQAVGGQPVIVTNTREQDIATSPCKLSMEAIIKLGAKKDGTLTAGEYTFIVGTGAYANSGPRMANSMAMNCTGPYKMDNVWCDAFCVYTNHTYATAYRGFGHTSMTFAVERMMDKLAAALQMDPLELRHKNAIVPGETTPTQLAMTPSNLGDVVACIDKLKKLIKWEGGEPVDIGNGRVRATGTACFWKTSNSPTDAISSALVIFNSDGSVNLQVGAVEIGPSTKTTLAQILAERLRVDINKVHVQMEVNTRTSPHHWKTVASMTTFMVGRAVEEAADDALKQILSIAAMALRCSPSDLALSTGRVYLKDNPDFYMDYADIAHGYKYENGNTVGSQVIGRGTYTMPHLSPLDKETGKGKPGPYLTPGA